MPNSLRIPITNVYMDGDYTGVVTVGSQALQANVILDTGSSTLALDGQFYNPTNDTDAVITDIAQEVQYGSGSWVGSVVQTTIAIGTAPNSVSMSGINVAVAYQESQNMFGSSNGILGLAYTPLDNAFTMPSATWPATFTYNQIQGGQRTYVTPYFTQLANANDVANMFAFYTQRSMVSQATGNPATDPLNGGWLILGGGPEQTDLYTGSFQDVLVVSDDYYSTNLKAIIIGSADPIEVPPPTQGSGLPSNSIIDSGTNSLTIDQTLFNTLVARFSKGDDRQFVHAMRAGYIAMADLNLAAWPNITFVMQGANGNDVQLVVTPQNYWQLNAPEAGYATAPVFGDQGQLGGQSILGLPLMNGYFTVFNRSAAQGMGVVSFATRT